MKQTRGNFNRMNLDDSRFIVGKGEYVNAMDISISDTLGVARTMKGNRKVPYTLPAGICTVVGAKEDLTRNRVIYFVKNSNNKHCVFEYNNTTRVITKLFENLTDSNNVDVLDLNGLILSINIVHKEEVDISYSEWIRANILTIGLGGGGLIGAVQAALALIKASKGDVMYFLDARGRPTQMHIDKYRLGYYKPVTRDVLDLAKEYPASVIVATYGNDLTRLTNNLRNRLFRFRYKFIYDENEETVWSPISRTPYPANPTDDTFTNVPTNNNTISLSIPTGSRQVKKIAIAMSYSNGNTWSDFALVDTLNKSDYGIRDNILFTLKFYNDSAYTPIGIRESIQTSDWVPRQAGAQELLNGNVLLFGDITEGFGIVSPTVTLTSGYKGAGAIGTGGSLAAVFSMVANSSTNTNNYSVFFTGTITAGVTIKIRLKNILTSAILDYASYVTVLGDTYSNITTGLRLSMEAAGSITTNHVSSGNSLTFKIPIPAPFELHEVSIAFVGAIGSNSMATWHYSSRRCFGLVYHDSKGRNDGVVTNIPVDGSSRGGFQVTFGPYAELGGQIQVPYAYAEISHQPPAWATSYSWVVTKDLTAPRPLMWQTSGVSIDTDYTYFNVSGIALTVLKNTTTADVLAYTFAKGDRMRLLKKVSDGTVYDQTYDAEIMGYVTNPKISGVDVVGTFVKIKKVAPFATIDWTSNNYIIQLYSPTQNVPVAEQAFFEFGQTYSILDAGLPTRSHQGMTADQNYATGTKAKFDFTEGDAYFRQRKIYLTDTTTASFYVQDSSFVDSFACRVSSVGGRPFVVNAKPGEKRFTTLVRFSEAYQAGTSINGLNKFYPENMDEYTLSFGPIKRLKARDKSFRVYQKHKVGNVPIYAQVIKNADGGDALSVTDKLLNRINYYAGEFGIGDTPESLSSNNFADYFCSSDRGVICRLSLDGITPISITEKANKFSVDNLPLRGKGARIYGVFDADENRYICAMEAVGTNSAKTFSFNERKNGFETFHSFKPEMMVCLGTLLITFKDGQLYTHDGTKYANYYGKQYKPSISLVFNDFPDQKKGYVALSQVASQLWECPSIVTNNAQESLLASQDFRRMESVYYASFLRDQNSPKGLLRGDTLRGNYVLVTLSPLDSSIESELTEVDVTFFSSQLNNR